MQKRIIALAIAGLAAAPAFAQVKTELYGVADAYVGFLDNGTDTRTVVDSGGQSSGRLGFRASNAFGGGLSGRAVLEAGYNIDTGTHGQGGRMFGRQAFVGLAGGFGEISFGRQYNQIEDLIAEGVGINTGGALGIGGSLLGGSGFRNEFSFQATENRTDSSIKYATPTMGGFTASIMYGAGGEAYADVPGVTAKKAGESLDIGLSYSNGPLTVAFAHNTHKIGDLTAAAAPAPGFTAVGADKQTAMGLGANFDAKVVKVYGTVGQSETSRVGQVDSEYQVYALGVDVPVLGGTFSAGYAAIKNETTGVTGDDSDGYTLMFSRPFADNASWYAIYSQLGNDANATRALGADNGEPALGGQDLSAFAVGITYKF